MDKSKRWMKGLPPKLIKEILSIDSECEITFAIKAPNFVVCQANSKFFRAHGVALCSPTHKSSFDVKKGKAIALGRVLKAIEQKGPILPIRNPEKPFPRKWKPAQIKFIKEIVEQGVTHKADFYERVPGL